MEFSISDNYSKESICYFILPVPAFIASLLPSAVLMVTQRLHIGTESYWSVYKRKRSLSFLIMGSHTRNSFGFLISEEAYWVPLWQDYFKTNCNFHAFLWLKQEQLLPPNNDFFYRLFCLLRKLVPIWHISWSSFFCILLYFSFQRTSANNN